MVSKSGPKRILDYLRRNNLVDVYIFLILSSDNLRNRAMRLDENIKELEQKIKNLLKIIEENPESVVPENSRARSMIKDIHYTELEVIQRLNILIELLAVYYCTIRTDLRKLPKSIGKKDFKPDELRKEFDYFDKQTLTDVWKNFKYSDVTNFSELSRKQQDIFQQMLERSAKRIQQGFRDIYKFQRNFREVYNKYKHTLSESTGIFGIDKKRQQIQTHIYMRHKENNKFYTYVIPLSLDEVQYFIEIAARGYKLLHLLIDNTLLHIVNEGKAFIPKTLFIEKNDEAKFKEIAEKVHSCIMPEFTSKVTVKPPDPKDIGRINRRLQENHIYRMNKDILDLDELLKGDITILKP